MYTHESQKSRSPRQDGERPGRHRPVRRSATRRAAAHAALAAVTTSTMAVSGVAVVGLLTSGDSSSTPDTNEATVTTLSPQVGASPALVAAVAEGAPASPSPRAQVALAVTNPDVTVGADEPVEINFHLADAAGTPLPDRDLLVQAEFPTGWTTFLALRTDASGDASYTARVLTTTNVRVVFEGDHLLEPAISAPGVVRVRPEPAAIPAQDASRGAPREPLSAAVAEPAPVAPAGTLGERAVYLASLQAGKPYVYGAVGPYTFDCSGLVQYVYKQLGKTLPRTTDQQYAATQRVAQGSEQLGDLIFFGQPGSIYHMGIYAGNGQIWVAPKTGDVVKLQDIWSDTYLVGRVT